MLVVFRTSRGYPAACERSAIVSNRRLKTADDHDSLHGDRPWVFFMVDCFFLITEFFVLTFKFKADEAVLPQKLPPGWPNRGTIVDPPPDQRDLTVSVDAVGGVAQYEVYGRKYSLGEFTNRLAAVVQDAPSKYIVRVSYRGDAKWGDVLAVFDSCKKVNVGKCGLIPLRGPDASGQAL